MVYDEARGVILLFGGQDRNINLKGDTWTWDGTVWRRVARTGPPARVHHALVYDKERGTVLLYGGHDGQKTLSDFWEWNGESWREIKESAPGPRSHHRMAFDEAQGKVHLFGNSDADGSAWTWDGSKWEPFVGATPPQRMLHAMTYDAARRRLILFGGYAGGQNLDDTWELIDDQWVQVDLGVSLSSTLGAVVSTPKQQRGERENETKRISDKYNCYGNRDDLIRFSASNDSKLKFNWQQYFSR
jgi:hypothetical protein